MQDARPKERILRIVLDEGSVLYRTPEIEHERAVAMADLLEDNRFSPAGVRQGPYYLHLSITDNRLHMQLCTLDDEQNPVTEVARFTVPMAPFRSIIRDYFIVCESYFEAIKHGSVSRVEAIDMGRRGIHNEGSELLASLLEERVSLDFDTARRLFTLICVLHIK